MTRPKWDVNTQPCPKCNRTSLVFDGSVKWRSGPRPPRELATKGCLGSSPRADFDVAHYLHCANCLARFYDLVDGRKPRLQVEKEADEKTTQGRSWPPGSIGDISAKLGYDVRDLKMAGYSDDEINQVLFGQRTLDDLLKSKPRSRR